MTDLNTAPCAREGCGAPQAWHDDEVLLAELHDTDSWEPNHAHHEINPRPWALTSGACIGGGCLCPGYIAPEPPKPERTAYVVEVLPETVNERSGRYYTIDGRRITPLADYLASHPQPATERICTHCLYPVYYPDNCPECSQGVPQPSPRMCVCGGREDEHGEDGRCSHVAKWYGGGGVSDGGHFEMRLCHCREFREAVA